MTRTGALILSVAIACVSVAAAVGVAQDKTAGIDGLGVAKAYIAGMEAGDLEALTELFIGDDRSSILENASDEGSWEHYRDHHLKPEMDAVKNFRFEIAKETEESFGGTVLVQQTGTFTVEVQDEVRSYRVAVSYVIVMENEQARIAHLHWSSRPKK